MKYLQFWRTWTRSYQLAGATLAACVAASLAVLGVSYFLYPQPTFAWQHVQEQLVTEIPLRAFSRGLVELVIPTENYVIFDQLVGGESRFFPVASYLFLALFFLSFSLLVAVVTLLPRVTFLAAMAGVVVVVTSLRLESLRLFGEESPWALVGLLLGLVGLTAFFRFFRKDVSLPARWLAFVLLLGAAAMAVGFFSGVESPFLHLAVAALPVSIAGTVLFIFLVAHEIPAALVSAISRGFSPTHSLRHVAIISTIYFVNLALAYAERFSILKLNFVYIDFFLLLTLSGILGLWGFRQRRQQVESVLEEPFASLAYLALALLAFGTLAFFRWSANDPVLDALGSLSIYAHLGFGLMFFLYVLSNFGAMLEKNLEVYKVLYKPSRMPYFTYRFAGMVATGAFLIYNGWQGTYHNTIAGFFNAAGDLHQHQGQEKTALAFYQRGGSYGFLNHKSNYNIAVIESHFFNFDKERIFFKRASERRPTEMSVVNYAFTHQREGSPLDAMRVLNESRLRTAGGAVDNMKGVLFTKLNRADSAAHYFLRSTRSRATRTAGQMNLIALSVVRNWPLSADSVASVGIRADAGVQSNTLALANNQGRRLENPGAIDLSRDTVLNLFTASWLHNYVVNQTPYLDTAFVARVAQVAASPANSGFQEVLTMAAAKCFYEAGEVEKALRLAERVIYFSTTPGKHNHLMALWALEQDAPDVAASYLNYATSQLYPPAALTLAVALTEAGQTPHAIQLWDSLQRTQDSLVQKLASQMVRVLASPPELLNRLTDEEKAAFVQYRLPHYDSAALFRMVQPMQDTNSQVRALLSFSKKLFFSDEVPEAVRIFRRLGGYTFSDEALYKEIRSFDLALLAAQQNYPQLARQIDRGIEFGTHQNHEKRHYQALIAQAAGRVAEADALFDWLGRSNPFYGPGVVDAARFYRDQGNPAKSYALLAEALQRNPGNIKILKAYVLAAADRGYANYARSALQTLQQQLAPGAFRQFLNQHKARLPL